ncbi:serum opacification factor [Streptococcus pyogenes]|uniref:serum opacification factor n=1 Tax=Streptococcus pyogenes TaxID=1314 RepID=UPI001330088D|nr:serum opacification factor [Streptococcus pyogenes]
MTNCKYKLRKLSVGLVSVGTMLIAPTVLGQEVSTGASSSTETSASSNNTNTASTVETSTTTSTSGTAASGTGSEAAVASSGGSQSSGTTPASPQAQTSEQPAVTSASSTSSSSEEKTPKAANTASSSATVASPSNGSNQEASAETEPQTMEVEKYTVDRENSELKVKDGTQPKKGRSVSQDTKLIKNRDGKQRDIVDVTRTVKTNEDGTIDVTVTVKPKQIDEGADVMALLDVSKKMTEDVFKNAKEKIKKLVTTLTSKSPDGQPNHNARNSVRLMTFYHKVNEPIELTAENVDAKLKEVWEQAKKDWDWGVDLQGAIHKAREIFNKEKEKKSGKRQHIVLFSQGESTFSYDINDKNNSKLTKTRITGKVTSSNPLLRWPPILEHTHKNGDMISDVKTLIAFASKLGIKGLSWIQAPLDGLKLGGDILGSVLGGGGLGEYLTLKEYDSHKLNEDQFNYTKRVGEGYHYHSFSNRESEDKMPLEPQIEAALKAALPKFEENNWFTKVLTYFNLKDRAEQAKLDIIMKVIKSVFYKRQYHYYNHNLSAIAEAKMAQEEGITFYSVDVTDSKTTLKRAKRQTAVRPESAKKESEEERNKKFDEYLEKMSEDSKFFTDVDQAEKFKDTLTNVTVTETFEDGVNVKENSCQTSLDSNNNSSNSNCGGDVKYQKSSESSWWGSTKESLTWTISKEQLKEAFEKNSSLTFKYQLQVNKQKLLDKNKNRTKRSISTENENSVTEKIISNTTTYKINGQEVKGNKLDDVKLTYTKETVPVPDVEGEVVPIPEKPLVEPMTPLYPAIPNYPTPQLPKDEDLEISGGHGPIVDIVEDTGTGVEGGAQNGVVSTQENKDPIVDITEDTQPSVSGSNDATVVEEDTAPKRPDILVGGQSDPIDITEDTQPGMSGANDATVIEEDTKPKRFFHFDNEPQAPEKPKEQPSLSLPQAPVYKAAHHLPASGDKREASFTIVALTIIGAAGLLSKKRRDTEEN